MVQMLCDEFGRSVMPDGKTLKCEYCPAPARWLLVGCYKRCSEGFSCCGVEEYSCDEHKAESLETYAEYEPVVTAAGAA